MTRHARCTCVRAFYQDGLVLEIQDDGVGVSSFTNGTGQGLQLRRTLRAVIGGALTLERVGDKTRVKLIAPRA